MPIEAQDDYYRHDRIGAGDRGYFPVAEPPKSTTAGTDVAQAVQEAFLAQFPAFRTDWPEAVQVAWLEAFVKVLADLK